MSIAVSHTDGHARRGQIATPYGTFQTPAFMAVGTQGTVKGITPSQLTTAGCECILGNTYHLMLRPGEQTVATLGDLHKFMAWDGPILTDSGGFQVFSLADANTMDEDGVTFNSHLNGDKIRLTPERSMAVQNALGADVMMAFDHCPPGDADLDLQREAMHRTLRWTRRCVESHGRPADQALFGIIQGGTDLALRHECTEALAELDLPGYALGGLAVGETYDQMKSVLDGCAHRMPEDKPRYLMGVGYPRDLVTAVAAGVDMFDCVLPSRNGRSGVCFTNEGLIRLKNSMHTTDAGPIEPGCDCYACENFSRGAIRHFLQAGEMLGPILASLHNIRFYQRLMADLRTAIEQGELERFQREDPRTHLAPASQGHRPMPGARPSQPS